MSAGGEAGVVPGTDLPAMLPAAPGIEVSRDGRFLIFSTTKKGEIGSLKLAVVDLSAGAGQQARLLDPDRRIVGFAHFAPDSKSVVYVTRESGADNLWRQPLDGSRGRALTNFASEKIQNFEYSPDEKMLGVM